MVVCCCFFLTKKEKMNYYDSCYEEHKRLRRVARRLRPSFIQFASDLKSGSLTWNEAYAIYQSYIDAFTSPDGEISIIIQCFLGYSLLDSAAIASIGDQIRDTNLPVYSVGAGKGIPEGLLLCYLRDKGVENPESLVFASDARCSHDTDKFCPEEFCIHVEWENAAKTVRKANAQHDCQYFLWFNWPNNNAPWAYHALRSSKALTVFYCGESRGGCTADDDFHDYLAENWEQGQIVHYKTINGIGDYLSIYHSPDSAKELVFNTDMVVNFVSMLEQ